MKTVFNLLNNKVMKNYMKYICLFLTIVGLSLGQKAWGATVTETLAFNTSDCVWGMNQGGQAYSSGTFSAYGFSIYGYYVKYNYYNGDYFGMQVEYNRNNGTSDNGYIILPNFGGKITSISVYTYSGAGGSKTQYLNLYIAGVAQTEKTLLGGGNEGTPATWSGLNISAGTEVKIMNTSKIGGHTGQELHIQRVVVTHEGSAIGTGVAGDGLALSAVVSPTGAGTITLSDNQPDAGDYITMTASPSSGYTFDHWVLETRYDCGGTYYETTSSYVYDEANANSAMDMPDYPSVLTAVFEETSNYSITYHIPSCATGSKPSNVTDIIPGSSQTLANVGGDVDGWTFGGWTTVSSNYVHGTSTFYAKNSSQTINSNWDLYPVYGRYLSTGSSETFSKKTSTMVAGDYIITPGQTNGNAIGADVTDTNVGSPISVTSSNTWSTMTTTDRKAMWQIAASGTKWTIKNRYTGKYLALKRNGSNNVENNKIYMSETVTDDAKWTITETGTAGMYHVGITVNDTYYSLKFYDNTWRASSSSETTIKCFFKHAGTPAAATAEYTVTPCNTHTVTYAANGGTGALPVDGSSPYTVGSTVVVLSNTLTKTGYNFASWSGNQGVGTKTPGQTFTMPDADVTLTAQWTAKTYNITLDNESPTTLGSTSVTMTYNSSSHTAITNPVKTGYTFAGWWSEDNGTGVMVMNASNVLQANVTGYTGAGGIWTKDGECTLYAKWAQNHKLTVDNVDHVTISTTNPTLAEGQNNSSVLGGTAVTLNHNTPDAPYSWAGWKVTKDADGSDVTASVVAGNTLTMPDYDVTVSALLFGDLVAFCEPEVEITLTQTDGGSDPLLITSGYGLGTSSVDASRTLRITVANATGSAVVNLSGTNLRFFKTNGSRTEIGASNLTCTAGALSTDIIVAYAPTSYTDDNIATPSITVTCEGTSKTFNNLVKARCLPEHFVIAAKINGRWCALPADLATSASPAPTLPAAYPISVDNEDAPRVAKVAPKTAIYGFSARNAVTSHTGGIRLDTKTGSSDGHLQAPRSNDLTYLWRPSTNASTGMQDWYLTSKGSSDENFYTYYIGVDPACTLADGTTPISRYLCIYGDKIMWTSSADETHRRFRILPIEKEVEPLDEIQVVEWASDKIRFMYLGNPDYKACVEIGGVLKSAAAAVLGTSLKIDEGVYEIAVSDLMSNAYKQLYIVIKNGDTEVGRQAVTIPLMVNTTTTVATAASGFTKTIQCPKMDLIVLSGGKLTADDATAYQFKSVSVYGGGKLIVDASKGLNAGNMYLRAGTITATPGSTPVTSYNYVYPQVYIGSGATLSTTDNVIYFDYLTNYEQYFGLALPYPVTINATTDIFYPSDIYGSAAKRGSFLLRVFDSKIRAAQGAVDAVWVDVESGSEDSGGSVAVQSATQRGLGYTMLGVPLKVSINGATPKVRQKYGIHRMKMDITDAATLATFENSNATYDVTAYSATSVTNAGWWLLGNPYMANLGGASVTGTSITVGSLGTNAQGQYEWQNKSVRYVTVPDDAGGDTYDQRTVDSYTFPAFKPFYVQVGKTGTVTFTPANRAAAAPKRFRNEEMPAEIATSIALNSTEYGDTTHLLIGDAFSDEYEIGDDLTKMPHANVNLFTISGANDLFANALNTQSALAGIPVGYIAPMAGSYEFTVNDKEDNSWIEHLWLTDLDLSRQTDLLVEPYEFETDAVTNKTRFMLNVVLKSPNGKDVTTGVDDVHGENERPFKFLYRDKLYILRGGQLYDATGKQVREINK